MKFQRVLMNYDFNSKLLPFASRSFMQDESEVLIG